MPRVKKPEQQPEPQAPENKVSVKKMPTPKTAESKSDPVKSSDVTEKLPLEESSDVLLETSLSEEFSSIITQVQQLNQHVTSLKNALRTLEKKTARELKQANKAKKKSKNAKANRQPSGFVKPTLISNELASFLNKPKGTELARTDVTKEIN